MTLPDKIHTWRMTRPSNPKTGEKGAMERMELPVPPLGEGEVLVEIAGCGVCHTDLSYFYDGVPTVTPPPLTLGHEISGTVVAGPGEWPGREVIVPAVMPCNSCAICASGRGNRCLAQKMPGNSLGDLGGYSSHIVTPAADLCVIEDRFMELANMAVIADAITTPYQAAVRADLGEGDVVVVTGSAGGVGSHMVQMAKALGARYVIGLDIDEERLKRNLEFGADAVINVTSKSPKEIKQEIKALSKERGLPGHGVKIFECSGSKPGQDLALSLLSFVGKLVVVGYTTAVSEYMLSKLMAFDAEIIGTWGCLPEYYPAVVELVRQGKVAVEPFIETRPMSTIAEVFEEVHSRKTDKRIVLIPDFT